MQTIIPPGLAAIAAGRDHISTSEYAKATTRASQTVRKNYCLGGECFGIRPVKIGNRLLWPVAQIAALLNGEAPVIEAPTESKKASKTATTAKR
jgi:hypothetical protein